MGQWDGEAVSRPAFGCRLSASCWPGFFSGLVDYIAVYRDSSPAAQMTRRMGRQSRYAVFEIIAEGDTITL